MARPGRIGAIPRKSSRFATVRPGSPRRLPSPPTGVAPP
ncbi:hypothetical protein FHT17_000749 [Novosphingobium sp. SG916]|nr:hypothetical protein [Novosphingobium sp. SG916]